MQYMWSLTDVELVVARGGDEGGSDGWVAW